jgi:hypothetical protein
MNVLETCSSDIAECPELTELSDIELCDVAGGIGEVVAA